MNQTKWFLQLNGQVQGPLSQDSLSGAIQNLNADNLSQALVWTRGLPEWIRAEKWNSSEQTVAQISNLETPAPQQDELYEKTFNQKKIDYNQLYRVQLNYIDQSPMTKNELMTFIAKQEDVSRISILDPKNKEWREIYAFPDIVEKLGLSRRKQPRVPILAQFSGKVNTRKDINSTVITISQGGMGFTENFELMIGDEVEGSITSPHFFQPINVKADVIYAGTDGYVGLKFSQIADEAKSALIDYIKKFGQNSNNTP